MKKIAVFNHKGGVSKTTTTFNLGWSLASLDKRVLLVDADSQCNLTQYALGPNRFDEFYESGNRNNLSDALVPVFKSQPVLISAIDCVEIKDKLWLCPGHINFTENEVQLGISMQLSSAFGSMQNLPGAINCLVEKMSEKYAIDYVLFDMNPSLSAINQDILISSDFFVIPSSPDVFSAMAMKSLARILPLWEDWAKSARSSYSEATYRIPDSTPKFLGYTINDYNLGQSAKPQKAFAKFMDTISKEVAGSFIDNLRNSGMVLETEVYKKAYLNMKNKLRNMDEYSDCYCLARISNFNKLIAISHERSVPIFEITDLPHQFTGQTKTLHWFKALFKTFAERVIELTTR